MVAVLAFMNSVSTTSIPLEIAENVHTNTPARVTVVSLYDDAVSDLDPDVRAFDVDIIPLGANSRSDPQAYQALRDLLRDADVLHTHHNSTGSLARLASIGTGAAVVNTEHNDHRHFSHLQNTVNCVTYPLVDAFISNSQSTHNSLRAYERPFIRAPHTVVYNGIDFERIEASIDPGETMPEGPVVATVGVMTAQKDQETLLQAMKLLVEDLPEARLVVVGDGSKRAELEQMARDLGIERSVHFTGYVPTREEVYGILKHSDVFAISSIYEGFCVAAVEAMGCGLPVVASDIEVLREVVADGGRFASTQDPASFSAELGRLLTDNEAAAALGGRARERAARFTIERTAEAYYDAYESVLD